MAIFGYPPFLDRSKFPFSRSKVQFVMPKATAKQLQGEIASGSEGIDRVIDALSQVEGAANGWDCGSIRYLQLDVFPN
jgi:hypothetical protein